MAPAPMLTNSAMEMTSHIQKTDDVAAPAQWHQDVANPIVSHCERVISGWR